MHVKCVNFTALPAEVVQKKRLIIVVMIVQNVTGVVQIVEAVCVHR